MKKLYNRILSCFLASILLATSMFSSAFASQAELLKNSGILQIDSKLVTQLDQEISAMNYDELYSFLIENFNASPEEAQILAQYHFGSIASTYAFPSNPKIGDTHAESYTINVSLTASAATLASLIVAKAKYVKLAEALAMAGAILSLGSEALGHKVKMTITYTYGYNNDGVLGWTPGYTTYEIID